MPRTVTLREATGFFLPLILWAQLMMVSHSIIHAALARLPEPTIALAGFSIAFAVHATLSAATMGMTQVGLSYVSDRRSFWHVLRFGAVLAAVNMGLTWLIAFTPLGVGLYGTLFGASARVVSEAQGGSAVFALVFPIALTRNTLIALLMHMRRTILVSAGTALRVASLAGWLYALRNLTGGAVVGASALVLCMLVECAFVVAVSRTYYRRLPAASTERPGFGEMWRFSWPLIINLLSENGFVLVINIFLGRLAQPDLALGAFGVVRGLSMLLLSPLRNLTQTAQALTHGRADLPVIRSFTVRALLVFTAIIAVLFLTPLRDWVLRSVMGLGPEMAAYCAEATLVFVVTPLVWSFAALYRGLLSGVRITGPLASSGVLRLAVVTVVCLPCLVWPTLNGALIGMLAMVSAFVAEALWLGGYFRRALRAGRAFPEPVPAAE